MSQGFSFEGTFGPNGTSRDVYIPPFPQPRGRTVIHINIKTPREAPVRDVTNKPPKPEKPPITFEGGDAMDAENAKRRKEQQRQQEGYSPELLERWQREVDRTPKNKMN